MVRDDHGRARGGSREGSCPIRSRTSACDQPEWPHHAGSPSPGEEETMTMRLSVVTLFVNDQDQALRFFVDRLGFVVSEDNRLGDYRWLLVRAPDTADVAINLALATTSDQRALVGKQG